MPGENERTENNVDETVSIGQVVNFVTEFNENAQIFHETLFPLLLMTLDQVNNQQDELNQTQMNIRQLEQRLASSLIGQRLGSADNAGFTTSNRTSADSPGSGPSITSG